MIINDMIRNPIRLDSWLATVPIHRSCASFNKQFNAQRHVTACHADFDTNVDDNSCNDELYPAEAISAPPTSQEEEEVHHHENHHDFFCHNDKQTEEKLCNDELSHKYAENNYTDYTEKVLLDELWCNPPAATSHYHKIIPTHWMQLFTHRKYMYEMLE